MKRGEEGVEEFEGLLPSGRASGARSEGFEGEFEGIEGFVGELLVP